MWPSAAFPRIEVFSKDTVLLEVAAVMFYRVVDARRAVYDVVDLAQAVRCVSRGGMRLFPDPPPAPLQLPACSVFASAYLPSACPCTYIHLRLYLHRSLPCSDTAQSQMKRIFGGMSFAEALQSQTLINEMMRRGVADTYSKWGLQVRGREGGRADTTPKSSSADALLPVATRIHASACSYLYVLQLRMRAMNCSRWQFASLCSALRCSFVNLQVERVEVQDLRPKATSDTATAMKKQMISERQRRSEFIQAEGNKAAMKLRSEGLKIVKTNLVSRGCGAAFVVAAGASAVMRQHDARCSALAEPSHHRIAHCITPLQSVKLPRYYAATSHSVACHPSLQGIAEQEGTRKRSEGDATAKIELARAEKVALDTIAESVEADGCGQTDYMVAKRYQELLRTVPAARDKTTYIPFEASSISGLIGRLPDVYGRGSSAAASAPIATATGVAGAAGAATLRGAAGGAARTGFAPAASPAPFSELD